LYKNSTSSKFRGISFKKKRFGYVWHNKNRLRDELFLEFFKCQLLIISPVEQIILLGELVQYIGKFRVVINKALVEVAKSKK